MGLGWWILWVFCSSLDPSGSFSPSFPSQTLQALRNVWLWGLYISFSQVLDEASLMTVMLGSCLLV